MKSIKKAVSLLLAVLVILPYLMSCGSEQDGGKSTTQSSSVNTSQPQTEGVLDSVPSNLNFDGETLNLLIKGDESAMAEYVAEEETGDIVNDAVYRRNKTVEERLNMKLNVIVGETWDKWSQTEATIKSSILAGDKAYDLIADWSAQVPKKILDNQYLNIDQLPYLDLSKPWWSKNMQDQLKVANKLYFATGDITNTMLVGAMVVFFNKKLQHNYGVPDLYQTVEDGKWTIDYMTQISKDIYKDLNGDGVKNEFDLYGVALSPYNVVDSFLQSSDIKMVKMDGDGIPSLDMEYDRIASLVDKVYGLLYENNGAYTVDSEGDNVEKQYEMFKNDQTFFFPMPMRSTYQYFRDMESDYGILPYPKFDESQEEYYTKIWADFASFMCVPVNCDKLELVGAFLETASSESHRTVIPALYETALKVKFSRDDVSARMLDIVREGISYNFASVYNETIGYPWYVMRSLMSEKSKDFASWYDKNEALIQKTMDKVVDNIEQLD
ncbi:MAG: hypothetical protein AB9835_06300 [Eubacteriales bacterium]